MFGLELYPQPVPDKGNAHPEERPFWQYADEVRSREIINESYQILMSNDCMPKRLAIHAHLALDEVETRDRRAKDPVARSHWQIIWLLAQGLASAPVAVVTGYTVNWIRTMARRYNQQGPAGLEDHRHRNPGAVGLFSRAPRTALTAALEPPPPNGGIWTGPQAAAWMAVTLGRRVHPQRGWEVLRCLGWTSKVPRPRHAKADPPAQAAFKKPAQPSCRRCSRPLLRTRWNGGRPINTVSASSPACAASGAPRGSGRGPQCHTAIRGVISTPLCIRVPAGRGGCACRRYR